VAFLCVQIQIKFVLKTVAPMAEKGEVVDTISVEDEGEGVFPSICIIETFLNGVFRNPFQISLVYCNMFASSYVVLRHSLLLLHILLEIGYF